MSSFVVFCASVLLLFRGRNCKHFCIYSLTNLNQFDVQICRVQIHQFTQILHYILLVMTRQIQSKN